jgi:hypothetical protein
VTAPGPAQVPVQAPVDILATLDETAVAAGIEPVSAWLRHLIVRTPELEAAVAKKPRPVILKRLAALAGELHSEPLARQLNQLVRRVSHRTTSPSRTGVGTRVTVPQVLREASRGTGSPWLDEQAMRLARQGSEIRVLLGTKIARLPTFKWPRQSTQAPAIDRRGGPRVRVSNR